jgi:ParB-like chromosome segregation protein Spo0J
VSILSLDSLAIEEHLAGLVTRLRDVPELERIPLLNEIRKALHEVSPFADEPVDCVLWVPYEAVEANDYNPNSVAPPEMRLLEHSISEDGYTQPIVAWDRGDALEVVDGFHRNRVGRERPAIRERVHGHLPVTIANESRSDRSDRIAATIRHNRARGKHRVDAMSDIVVELKRRNWSNEKIGRELGMDRDEVLRLCQITGLAELFSDQDFSRAWDVEGVVTEEDFVELTEDVATYENTDEYRVVNTSDPGRIFHTHDKWECYAAGFYAPTKPGLSRAQGEEIYRVFFSDLQRFRDALEHVISEWKHSCEHYLTNAAMNRIAWLGQASVCYATGVPASYRSGFSLLTEEQQTAANELALEYLNRWLVANGRDEVTLEEAYSYDRQSDIY